MLQSLHVPPIWWGLLTFSICLGAWTIPTDETSLTEETSKLWSSLTVFHFRFTCASLHEFLQLSQTLFLCFSHVFGIPPVLGKFVSIICGCCVLSWFCLDILILMQAILSGIWTTVRPTTPSVLCGKGTYLAPDKVCTLCPLTTYNNRERHTLAECFHCLFGYQTKQEGSTSFNQCLGRCFCISVSVHVLVCLTGETIAFIPVHQPNKTSQSGCFCGFSSNKM